MVLKRLVCMTSLTLNAAFAVRTESILPFCGWSYVQSQDSFQPPPDHMIVFWQLEYYATPFTFCQLALLIRFSIYCTYVSSTQLKLKSVFPVEYAHKCCRDTKLRSLPAACGSDDFKTGGGMNKSSVIKMKACKTPKLMRFHYQTGSFLCKNFFFFLFQRFRCKKLQEHRSSGQFFVIILLCNLDIKLLKLPLD